LGAGQAELTRFTIALIFDAFLPETGQSLSHSGWTEPRHRVVFAAQHGG
jgi:hypothetical protein